MIVVFNRNGVIDSELWSAIVIQMLIDNPEWLHWEEGRELLRICNKIVKGSFYEFWTYKPDTSLSAIHKIDNIFIEFGAYGRPESYDN